MISFNDLQGKRDRKMEERGQIRGRSGDTTNKNNRKKEYGRNSDEFRLAILLRDLICERRPSFKKPNMKTWAKHIDLTIFTLCILLTKEYYWQLVR